MPAGVEQCIAAAGVGSNKGLHHSRSDPEFHDSESTTDHTHVASANQWGEERWLCALEQMPRC